MNTVEINKILSKKNPDFKKSFKEVYYLLFDKKISSLSKLDILIEDFLLIEKIVNKKLKNHDVTFDIGYKYFRGTKLKLSKDVFVPQYDTEQIIDLVLEKKINIGNALEVGSGTGAISISLFKETKLIIDSIDINPKAIYLSRENDQNKKINFFVQDYFNYNPKKKYDLLISNPPYISKNDKFVEDWVLKNQPIESFYAKNEGFSFYISFFNRVEELLNNGAYIIIEIGYSQGEILKKLACEISNKVEVIKDYSGLDRFMVIKYEY